MDSFRGTGNLFSDVTTEIETVGGQDYLTVEFTASAYFQNSRTGEILDTAPHSSGGEYLDVCGTFDLTAKQDGEEVGKVEVNIVPYDTFRTMEQIYEELDDMVTYAEENTDIYVEKYSMGKSSGVIYEAPTICLISLLQKTARLWKAGLNK